MPDFRTADQGRLESSLQAPRAQFGGHRPYTGLEEQAAVLLYHLVKNHPFPNGNKRFATAAYLVFLALNGWWPEVEKDELIELVEATAASDASQRDTTVRELADFTQERLIEVEEAEAEELGLGGSPNGWGVP